MEIRNLVKEKRTNSNKRLNLENAKKITSEIIEEFTLDILGEIDSRYYEETGEELTCYELELIKENIFTKYSKRKLTKELMKLDNPKRIEINGIGLEEVSEVELANGLGGFLYD